MLSKIKSIYVVAIIGLMMVMFRAANPPNHALGFDTFGYYIYLPAAFVYDDPLLENSDWLDSLFAKYEPSGTMYQIRTIESGNRVFRYSGGMAVFYAPYFFVADAVAPLLGHERDGMSKPYQQIITWGCLLYGIIGLLFLRLILLRFFSEKLSSLLLLLIVFGTNHFQLTAGSGLLLTHNISFLLYGITIYSTIRWHEKPAYKWAILVGLGIGLAILTRPSEMVLVLFPLLYNVGGLASIKQKLRLIGEYRFHIATAVILTCLVGLPQMVYWKMVTGDWLYNTYKTAGEGFQFSSPFLSEFLFSFRKGWLLYTPLMALSILGFVSLWKAHRNVFFAIVAVFLAHLWFDSSWTCWWYAGGSFSSRTLLPTYVLLSIPLGLLIGQVAQRPLPKVLISMLITSLVVLNLFQTFQFETGVISRTRMTKEFYFAIFGKSSATEADRQLLSVVRSHDPPTEETLAKNYVAQPWVLDSLGSDAAGPVLLHPDRPFSLAIKKPYSELAIADHFWTKVTAEISPVGDSLASPISIVFHMMHKGEAYHFLYNGWPTDESGMILSRQNEAFYMSPEVRSEKDVLAMYAWNKGKDTCLLKSLTVTLYHPKDR